MSKPAYRISAMTSAHTATRKGRLYSLVALCFAAISALLFANYISKVEQVQAATVATGARPALSSAAAANVAPATASRIAVPSPRPAGIVRAMPVCGSGKRVNCVVDGDTIWVDREKIRLESMNAPEVNGGCGRERELAARATRRLSQLLSSQPFTVVRGKADRYGRTLASVKIDGSDVGMVLVDEGLAHVWQGRKQSWC